MFLGYTCQAIPTWANGLQAPGVLGELGGDHDLRRPPSSGLLCTQHLPAYASQPGAIQVIRTIVGWGREGRTTRLAGAPRPDPPGSADRLSRSAPAKPAGSEARQCPQGVICVGGLSATCQPDAGSDSSLMLAMPTTVAGMPSHPPDYPEHHPQNPRLSAEYHLTII